MHAKPKKSLGQNFLNDKNILKKIVSACDFSSDDIVLEIGAGKAELTRLVAERVKKVYAVEIDHRLESLFKEQVSAQIDKVEFVNQDILKTDLGLFFKGDTDKIRVIGNIPYYITTPIIEYLLQNRNLIRDAFLTVQKEFAQRMVSPASAKEYGALSCFVQYYAEPKILFTIKKGSFYPLPKVDSSFIKLLFRSRPAVKADDPELFFRVIRSSFGQRRKALVNSLRRIIPQEKLHRFFEQYGIDRNIRPERLSLQDFANLANIVKIS